MFYDYDDNNKMCVDTQPSVTECYEVLKNISYKQNISNVFFIWSW